MSQTTTAARGGRRLVAMAATLSFAVFAAACSGGSAGDNNSTSQKLLASLPAAEADIDSLTWNLTKGEPDTLDPRNAATYSGGQVAMNLCDSLVRIDPEYKLSPNLVSFEQETPTKLVFTQVADAKFWDGTPVTAEDIAFSLSRSRAPDSLVSFFYANVKSIDVTGEKEVTVTFATPDELFINEMSTIAGLVVKKDYVEKNAKSFGTAEGGLMCSGPFKLDQWKTGDSISVSRNDGYWNEEYRARAAAVKFTFVSDSTALRQALNAGEIDGAYEVAPDAVNSLRAAGKNDVIYGPSTQSLQLNVANPGGITADTDFMRGLQKLIDREALANVIFKGAATPLYTFITPTTWPADQKAEYQTAYDAFAKERAFDVDAAKKLIDDSAYDGEDLTVAIQAGDTTASKTAQLFQQQAAEAGVKIKIDSLQALAFSQAGYDASKRKGFDFLLNSSFNGVQDPLEPAGFVYLPKAFYNYTNFQSQSVTENLTNARQSFDPAERAALFLKAQAEYEEAETTVPLVSTNTITVLDNQFTGAVTSFAYWAMPQMALIGAAK
jgi:peptide/nickel transport system substrate-binding protein